jgi:hypothetical protein
VYVVLTSSSQGNQNNVRVLSYVLDAKGHLGTPKSFDFSVSYPPIVSAAAFPDQKLFLLESNGSILNFVESTDARHQSVPGNVQVDSSVAAPLSVSPQDFKEDVTVPVASSAVSQGNGPLMVTGISPTSLATLSAGQVNNVTHLYVGDSYNHRILDLVANPTVIVGGPTPAPTASSTPASSGQGINFQLVNQFVSSNYFTQVRSIAAQPNSSQLNVLTQNASGQNLVTFDTAAQSNCPS